MPDRPSITDESVLLRWMKLEIGKINESIVVERKTVIQLLAEEHPSASTKGGKEHFFDADVVRIFEKSLPKELQGRLRLPILFYFDMEVTDSCYITDEAAVEALKILGEISPLRTLRKGRLWVSRALVYGLIRKYPTAIQIVMG